MRALCCPFAITRRERLHLQLVRAQANDCETLSRLQHEASRTRGRDPKFEAPWGLLPDRLLGLLGALEGTSSKEELLRSQLFVPSGTAIKASPSFLQQALGLVSGPRRTSCNRTPRRVPAGPNLGPRVAPNGTRPYDGAHKLREADGFLELLRVFEARSSAVLHARGVPQQETLHAVSMRDATRR